MPQTTRRLLPLGRAILLLAVAFPLFSSSSVAQSALSEAGVGEDDNFLIQLDAYVKYGGDIDVIDGMTGKDYHSDSAVVKAIHSNFPKIMGGLHNKLLALEALYMDRQLKIGVLHGEQLSELAKTFNIRGFRIDDENWLKKEQTILRRLHDKPFFKIKEIVVWEKEELSAMALRDNPRAQHLRFNPESLDWERRVLTKWDVHIRTKNRYQQATKIQGLNLDTNEGFHISDVLPGSVYTSAFKEVSISYPIIVSRRDDQQDQIDRLQKLIVQNLSYIYDPFSWAAHRKTRFRARIYSDFKNHFDDMGYRVKNRDWFDPVISNLLNDIVTVKLYGLDEIYDFYVVRKFYNSANLMGKAADPLNWNEGEDRKVSGVRKNQQVKIWHKSIEGWRFVLLDMYLRYGDTFVDNLREKLTTLKAKVEPEPIFRQTIEEVSGVSADTYMKAAIKAQISSITDFKKSRYGD